MRRLFWAVSVVGIVLVFNSCLQDTLLFPVEPRISNASMLVIQDPDTALVDIWTLTITFDYEDGDGDIGGFIDEKGNVFSDSANLELVDNRTLPAGYTWPVVLNCREEVSSVGLRDFVCSRVLPNGRVAIDSVFTDTVSYSSATVAEQTTFFDLPNLTIDSRVPSVSGQVTFRIGNVRVLPFENPAETQDLSYNIRIRDFEKNWSNSITVTGRLVPN